MAGEVEGCGRMGGGYASRRGMWGGVPETQMDAQQKEMLGIVGKTEMLT